MTEFLESLLRLPEWKKFLWVLLCLSLCWILEGVMPLASFNYRKWKHAGVNLVFLALTLLIASVFGLAIFGVTSWTEQNSFGILHLLQFPLWIELLLSILLLDLAAQYGAHWLLHHVKWMWKFHMVHHSDTKVDATTGTRHHPGDYLIREVFSLAVVLISGMPFPFYLLYRITTVLFTYLTHANIAVPLWLDRPLSLVFVTPNMHKFHHHFERPWTDTNFGNIFSIWDRIFGTMVYDDPRKVDYGLDVLDAEADEDLAYQFRIPFNPGIKTDS